MQYSSIASAKEDSESGEKERNVVIRGKKTPVGGFGGGEASKLSTRPWSEHQGRNDEEI